jgi:multiple sugar transport system substrate-binding protein
VKTGDFRNHLKTVAGEFIRNFHVKTGELVNRLKNTAIGDFIRSLRAKSGELRNCLKDTAVNLKNAVVNFIRSLRVKTGELRNRLKDAGEFIRNRFPAPAWETGKVDSFLFLSLVLLVTGLFAYSIAIWGIDRSKRIDLVLSAQWESLFDRDSLNELIHEFEDQNPHLRIRLPARLPDAENQPDIVFFDDSRFGVLVGQNALRPLNPYTQNPDSADEWAIPLVLSMDLLFYNIDLLQSAGFDRPPKSRDEFIRYAQAITSGKSGALGTAFGLSPDDPLALKRYFFSWLWAAGLPLISNERPMFDGRAAADLIAFIGQLRLAGGSHSDKTGEQLLREFAQGRLAMIIAPVQAIPRIREQADGMKFGITVIPGTSSPGKNRLGFSGFYAGISGTSSHPDEAWTFLAFLAEKSPVFSGKIKTAPGSSGAGFPDVFQNAGFSENQLKEDPLYAKAWEIFESSDIAETYFSFPQAAELEKVVLEELRVFFDQGRSPRDTAEAIQKRWDLLF